MTPGKILVTGATGFIGSRLCERLALHYHLPYRALVRSFTKATRIARMGADMVAGDLMDRNSLTAALEGCDAVVHLAHADDETAPRATRNLLTACLRARIRRFVYVSSMAVHGPAPGPECAHEETATIRRYGEAYPDSKAAQEELVREAVARHGFPAAILRPTIVYGPYGPFVTEVVRSARTGQVTLIDEGKWVCNAVYVDDVCDAIHAALWRDEALGKPCFVTADQPITWQDFVLGFARMVDPLPVSHSVSADEVRAHWASLRPTWRSNLSALGRLAMSRDFHGMLGSVPAFHRAIVGSKKVFLKYGRKAVIRKLKSASSPRSGSDASSTASFPDSGRLIRETCAVAFSNARARRLLAWEPKYDFEMGARLTRTWLEFARVLSARTDREGLPR
jgi:nucleoside-diphosphate-sugar epimerase